VAREVEDVFTVLEEAVLRQQRAELAHLVEEARLEPVVAVELVLLHVREHRPGEPEQLLERRPCLLVQQGAVLLREPVALARELLCRSLDVPARLQRLDVACERRVRDARIVVPAAVVVVEAVAGAHVEPGILDLLELLEPGPALLALAELGVDLAR
jgi:hypothetical protein